MRAGSENCHSIRYAHTPHTGGDETTNLSVTRDIPRIHRRSVSKRDAIHADVSSFLLDPARPATSQATNKIFPMPPFSAAA
jgi:hypothetical protein